MIKSINERLNEDYHAIRVGISELVSLAHHLSPKHKETLLDRLQSLKHKVEGQIYLLENSNKETSND